MQRRVLRSSLSLLLRRYATTSSAPTSTPVAETALKTELESLAQTTSMTPLEIVEHLDKYIIGQNVAKRAVAVALRNRWRRHRVSKEFRDEIYPKNILMIGPTGVGKTEISRRVAKLTNAPFLRVECTKFTEVGYHGRDVDSIAEDLYKAAISLLKGKIRDSNKEAVKKRSKDIVLRALCGSGNTKDFEEFLDNGSLDENEIELEVPIKPPTPRGGGEQPEELQAFFRHLQGAQKSTRKQRMKVREALKVQEEIEMEKLLDNDAVAQMALKATEEDGIVVLDEIDKICTPSDIAGRKHTVSAEGVQQDLLPLVEGTVVTTKQGVAIKTDHILFIASGAFSGVKPSDMIAELQGRLPLRVELQPLTRNDFYRILKEPKTNLLYQNIQLMKTEGVDLEFTDDAVREMAEMAFEANSTVQNIGARRLITVVEKIMEHYSFDAPDLAGQKVVITAEIVRKCLGEMLKAQDLHRLII
eukprot:RCo009554